MNVRVSRIVKLLGQEIVVGIRFIYLLRLLDRTGHSPGPGVRIKVAPRATTTRRRSSDMVSGITSVIL